MAEIDYLHIGGNGEPRAHFVDSLAFDQDDGIGARGGARSIDQTSATDGDMARRGLGRQKRTEKQQQRESAHRFDGDRITRRDEAGSKIALQTRQQRGIPSYRFSIAKLRLAHRRDLITLDG